jgi:hypothetical protein
MPPLQDHGLPKVFCWINGGKGTDWVCSITMAEDGTCLGQHVSSSDCFAMRDSGFMVGVGFVENNAPGNEKRAAMEKHYPDGFDVEWVDDPLTHAGLLAAYKLNQAMHEHELAKP